MKLYHVVTGLLRVNTYILVNESTDECVIIDCGERYKQIKQTLDSMRLKPVAVLLTHAHFDHSGCAKRLQDDGARIYISKIDAPKLLDDRNLSADFGRKFDYLTADYLFSDGEEFEIAGIKFKAILTPGHTDGSATFIAGDMLFTGDTLFSGSVGRTDFVSGSRDDMVKSVKRLFALDGDYSVYPGHDGFTTLEHERKYNLMADYD